jgi:hypothetical protein
MSKKLKRGNPSSKRPARLLTARSPSQADFEQVLRLIDAARSHAVAAVNTTLIELYWAIGEYIAKKIAAEGWGKGTVQALGAYIQRRQPNARGFSSQNLWRMRQFYEAYQGQPKLSPLVRELPWNRA